MENFPRASCTSGAVGASTPPQGPSILARLQQATMALRELLNFVHDFEHRLDGTPDAKTARSDTDPRDRLYASNIEGRLDEIEQMTVAIYQSCDRIASRF